MNWLKKAIIKWAMRDEHEAKISLNSAGAMVKDDSPDNDTIRFYLSSAVGGRILRVNRETHRPNVGYHCESQTYVIPSGEDVGARVTKIINLEILK